MEILVLLIIVILGICCLLGSLYFALKGALYIFISWQAHKKRWPYTLQPRPDTGGELKIWYIAGKPVKTYEEFQKLTKCTDAQIIMLKLRHGKIETCNLIFK